MLTRILVLSILLAGCAALEGGVGYLSELHGLYECRSECPANDPAACNCTTPSQRREEK